MDFIGQIFGLIGGSQKSIDQSRAAQDADRKRAGLTDNSKAEYYIFFALLVVLLAIVFNRKK